MDWSSVAPLIEKFGVPILKAGITAGVGAIPIIGPLAAPFVADAVGNLIADKLGVEPTPDAVKTAIQTQAPEVVSAKLQAAEAEAGTRWPALADIAQAEEETARVQITTTADSMKSEVLAATTLPEGFWRTLDIVLNSLWRPLFAMEWLLECFCFAILLGITFLNNDQFDVDAIVKLWPLLLPYMAARFGLIGYHMNLRTRDKETVTDAVTNNPKPIAMDDIKKMLRAAGVKVK